MVRFNRLKPDREAEAAMNVGMAAERSGLPAKTVRYYEEIGLVAPARRENGYRDYDERDVSRLAFVQRARALGFSIGECRELLTLQEDGHSARAEVRRLAEDHVRGIGEKIAALEAMRARLARLIEACRAEAGEDCPILDDRAGHVGNAERTQGSTEAR